MHAVLKALGVNCCYDFMSAKILNSFGPGVHVPGLLVMIIIIRSNNSNIRMNNNNNNTSNDNSRCSNNTNNDSNNNIGTDNSNNNIGTDNSNNNSLVRVAPQAVRAARELGDLRRAAHLFEENT